MGRRLQRLLQSEQFECRRPLAADLAALDVNDDMKVTALDALIVINDINQRVSGKADMAEAEAPFDCDTNNDGAVTPIDALNVVNQLNSGVVDVPANVADDTVSDTVGSEPVDSTDPSLVESNPDDNTSVTSPDDSGSEDWMDDDSGSPDTNEDDTSPDDSAEDETDGNDDGGDSPGGDSPGDDSPTDEDSTDEDSDVDDTDCDHGRDDASNSDRHDFTERERRGDHGHPGRGDWFAEMDVNADGALTSDEVPEGVWNRLSAADSDGSDSVTQAELDAHRQAQRVAAVEAFFEHLDRDDSGTLTADDVAHVAWFFLARVDANSDGAVTIDELLAAPLINHLLRGR